MSGFINVAVASRLTWIDGDFDRGVRPENLAVNSVMLRVPVRDAPPDLAQKVEAALLRQVPEISDQSAMACSSPV